MTTKLVPARGPYSIDVVRRGTEVITRSSWRAAQNELLDAMSSHVRQIVEQDAKQRLVNVLQAVHEKRRQKLLGVSKLQSVLTQVIATKPRRDALRRIDWGTW